MIAGIARWRGLLSADAASDRVVPPSGFTARLTVFTAAAMAFLAVLALALALAAGRLAGIWADELGRASTVRIAAPAAEMPDRVETALRVLETTPGIASARPLDAAEQRALLAPWFGPDLPVEDLPLPKLIEVVETDGGYDGAGLRLRLEAEVPGAVLDDHTRWRAPLVTAATRLRGLGWAALLLIIGAMAAMTTLAANASLAANARVIEVLRLVGATDAFIVGAFVRRFTLRALGGAAAGTVAAMAGIALLPSADAGGFLTGLGFRGWHWIVPLAVPPLAALAAFLATGAAARRVLKDLA